LGNNFYLIESKNEGSVDIYSNDFLKIQISKDPDGQRFLDISGKQKKDRWFDLSIIRSIVLKNNDILQGLDF